MKWLFYIGFLLSLPASAQQISEVIIQGNKKTRTSFIKKVSDVQVGSVLDSTVLEADIIRLIRLPGIAHAYYQVNEREDGQCAVVYGVEENFTIIPSANIDRKSVV